MFLHRRQNFNWHVSVYFFFFVACTVYCVNTEQPQLLISLSIYMRFCYQYEGQRFSFSHNTYIIQLNDKMIAVSLSLYLSFSRRLCYKFKLFNSNKKTCFSLKLKNKKQQHLLMIELKTFFICLFVRVFIFRSNGIFGPWFWWSIRFIWLECRSTGPF